MNCKTLTDKIPKQELGPVHCLVLSSGWLCTPRTKNDSWPNDLGSVLHINSADQPRKASLKSLQARKCIGNISNWGWSLTKGSFLTPPKHGCQKKTTFCMVSRDPLKRAHHEGYAEKRLNFFMNDGALQWVCGHGESHIWKWGIKSKCSAPNRSQHSADDNGDSVFSGS